jgi:holo-[acyl-carrier protein] synthase
MVRPHATEFRPSSVDELAQDDTAGPSNGFAVIVGVGIDVADVARYRFGERELAWFARKVYTEHEMSYAMRKRNWHERLAGFFAAKEATRKAFGHAIPWRWVGVVHERTGKPTIELREAAARLVAARGVRAIHLTITHTEAVAAAVVILES